MSFEKMYLIIIFFVFNGILLGYRTYLLRKNTGINPLTFDKSDDAHGYIGKVFKLIGGVTFLIIMIYAFGGKWYAYLMPVTYLDHQFISLAGWIILHLVIVWIFMAQIQMADSWRIGIDTENKTELVTKGQFTISRNPIFLGIIISWLAIFMILPNMISFALAVLTIVTINIQIRLEEAYLQDMHGESYTKYRQKVRRWL